MPQVTIVPKYINPPKGNARSASIKDENGGYWGIHPGDMSKFQQNVPVTVEYSTSENNGKVYYNIKSIVGQQAPANPQAQQNFAPVNTRMSQLQPQNNRPQPNPQADPRKSEDIFVCGVVNHAIAHQSYPLERVALANLASICRLAWRMSLSDMSGRNLPPDNPVPPDQDGVPFPGSPDDYGDIDNRG